MFCIFSVFQQSFLQITILWIIFSEHPNEFWTFWVLDSWGITPVLCLSTQAHQLRYQCLLWVVRGGATIFNAEDQVAALRTVSAQSLTDAVWAHCQYWAIWIHQMQSVLFRDKVQKYGFWEIAQVHGTLCARKLSWFCIHSLTCLIFVNYYSEVMKALYLKRISNS